MAHDLSKIAKNCHDIHNHFEEYNQPMATTTMNISLPDTLKAFIEERLIGDGYGTASEYVRELIRADQRQREEQKLEKLLLDRLQKGTEMEFDLADVRAGLAKRLGRKK